ncbi:MAG: preprotein translocase subunit YajC [Tannerella sp.]|jgi:preprotein translocase subunit YajC|nr:preprotein translocase subunit YajC [Tannerella sp.]
MNVLTIFLQNAAGGKPAGGASGLSGIIMLVAIVAIFYFFMIRPQQKRQKDIQKAREAMKTGDRVVTSGGLYGKVREISDKYMMVEIADGIRVKVDKASVFSSPEDVQQQAK